MNLINAIGFVTNVCTGVAFDNIVKPLVKKTGNKVVDKVVVPWGTCVMSWMVASAAQDYIVGEVTDVTNSINAVKKVVKMDDLDDFDDEFDVDIEKTEEENENGNS